MFDKILSIVFSKKALIVFAILLLLVVCFMATGCDGLTCLANACGGALDCYCNNCSLLHCLCGVDNCTFREKMVECSINCGIECNEMLGDCALSRCLCLHGGCFTECNNCEETGCYGGADTVYDKCTNCYQCTDSACTKCGYEDGCVGFCSDCKATPVCINCMERCTSCLEKLSG